MKCEALFQPITIGSMTIRNRVMLPGITTRLCLDGGFVSDEMIAYYRAIAHGGCGLVVVEATSVHAPSAPKNFLQICSDDHIPGLRKLTDALHEEGARVSIQLWQGGFAAWATDPSLVSVVPSEMDFRGYKMQGASKELIAEVVKAYGEAARRAYEAGFDAVEFHCGHQYSPAHFLSGFNKRTDEYGGNLENRARYPLECIRAIRANVPSDFPIGMRVVAQDDGIENGNTLDDKNLIRQRKVVFDWITRGIVFILHVRLPSAAPPRDETAPSVRQAGCRSAATENRPRAEARKRSTAKRPAHGRQAAR